MASYPQLGERVLAGTLTLPEAMGFRKQLESMSEQDRPRAYAMIDQPNAQQPF
jgi:hypothetical protein